MDVTSWTYTRRTPHNMASVKGRVGFEPDGWTHSKPYALRPCYPAVWGGGCRESIDYKRAKTPPRLMNGASTLLKRGGSRTRGKRRCHRAKAAAPASSLFRPRPPASARVRPRPPASARVSLPVHGLPASQTESSKSRGSRRRPRHPVLCGRLRASAAKRRWHSSGTRR